MRTVSAGELTVLGSAAFRVSVRVSVKNGSGTYKDMTALGAPALSYLESAEIDADVDQPVAQATVFFKRDEGALSLSPLRDDSTLNRLDDNVTYSPLLDAGRRIKIEVAETAYGVAPAGADWKNVFEGVIDVVEFDSDPIRVVARDDGGRLVDTFTAGPTLFDYTSAPQAVETVIQTILDNQIGVGVIPLYTPASPGYSIKTFKHDRESVMDAIQRLGQSKVGYDLRYAWKESTTEWRLTYKDPNRAKVVPDVTFGAGMYIGARQLSLDRTNVRNRIEVVYGPSSGRNTATANDATSQTRFGIRTLHIEEASDSPISTLAEAQAMADAILSDLALPKADLEVEMLLYWPLEIFDLVRFSNNSVHFNSNQDLAVVGVKHVLGPKTRTFLRARGKPAGAYRSWVSRSFPTPEPRRQPPTAKITFAQRTRQNELVTLDGALGAADITPREWRTTIGSGAPSAWTAAALPSALTVARKAYFPTSIFLEVRQGDGQIASAYYSVAPFMDDAGSTPREEGAKAGLAGVATKAGGFNAQTLMNDLGDTVLIDQVGKVIKPGLGIGAGVRGESDVAFGASVKFATNRHNETKSGLHTDSPTFSISYEQVPEIRILPQTYRTPAAGDTIELKALSPTVSGCTIRAVSIAGLTSTARSDDMAATLNGTPVGAGITIGAPSSEAFCNLSNANNTATTYKVFYDVNTTSKSGGGLTRIAIYKNATTGGTVWTQVGQRTYDDGVNLTGEHIDFSAALDANWDVRIVVTYSAGTPSVNATVVADRVDYDQITGGTTTSLTNVTEGAVLLQAVEPS